MACFNARLIASTRVHVMNVALQIFFSGICANAFRHAGIGLKERLNEILDLKMVLDWKRAKQVFLFASLFMHIN